MAGRPLIAVATPGGGAAAARRAAASIVREGRFRASSVPRPLHGVLQAIGGALRSAARAVGHQIDALGHGIPGGTVAAWILVALALGAAAMALGRVASRRGLRRRRASGDGAATDAATAAALMREAEEAERRACYDEALALRFRAGLIGLSDRELVRSPGSLPSGQLSRVLRSADFDALARRFDEVAYGGDPAGAADVAEARERWREVLDSGAST